MKAIREFGIKIIVEELLKVEEEGLKQKKKRFYSKERIQNSDFGFEEVNIEYFDICLGGELELSAFFFMRNISKF